MEEFFKKYGLVLLENCLKIENDQPLFISYNKEVQYFVDIVVSIAKEKGIKDIYLDSVDPIIKHDLLISDKSIEELRNTPYWNKEMWNTYAKKNAAFLMIASENPGLMKDVDEKRITEMNKYSMETRTDFDKARDKSKLSWCIACCPTKMWADDLFPDSDDSVNELWNKILDICLIKEENPGKLWDDRMKLREKRANILNKYQFKYLKYKNSKGTDLLIELPKNHIWQTALELIDNKKKVLVNFPTEEVFTSPNRLGTNGIVYSTKPLNYNDIVIEDFWLKFKDGKVIDFDAKKGKEILKGMINIVNNSDYLGEVALVDYDSPIEKSNIVFKETLFDENASCHLALGASFPECLTDGLNMNKEELLNNGLNICDSHVDFMIGSKDLEIIGVTEDNTEYKIFTEAKFSDLFNC